jgi:hypothetical protein
VTQTAQDIAALRLLDAGLGPIQVLKVINEENKMTTETAPADFTGEDGNGWAEATGGNAAPTATYPEYPYSLADHVYTWSPKLPDGSMLVIRAQTADGLVEAVENMAPLAPRLKAAWQGVVGQPQAAMPPQGGVNYNPQMPPRNQPFPGQPAWQQAGAPQAPQAWAPPASPVPQGWYKLTVPFPQKASFDAIVSQYNFRKGDPAKGGQVSWQKEVKSWFCAPDIAQAFAQFNPVVAS